MTTEDTTNPQPPNALDAVRLAPPASDPIDVDAELSAAAAAIADGNEGAGASLDSILSGDGDGDGESGAPPSEPDRPLSKKERKALAKAAAARAAAGTIDPEADTEQPPPLPPTGSDITTAAPLVPAVPPTPAPRALRYRVVTAKRISWHQQMIKLHPGQEVSEESYGPQAIERMRAAGVELEQVV